MSLKICTLCLLICLLSCVDSTKLKQGENPAPLPPLQFPTTGWATAQPAELGVDPVVLDSALVFLASHCKEDGLEEVMVIRNGYLLWAGDSIDKVHDIWSCTKSFTSTAVGLMAEEGILQLDQRVAEHEPSLAEQYPEATYRHFLTMTSGYNAEGSTRWASDVSEDWSNTPYTPTTPLFPPGSAYTYWDEAMIMLGRALTQAAGTSLNNYLDARLFRKIGIPKREWWGEETVLDGVPINFGGTGLKMSASEQARFGHLVLNQGNWNGEQLAPADFLAAATKNQVSKNLDLGDTDRKSTDGRGIYGYNWWVINKGSDAPVAGAFTSGLNHNVCLIVPEWGMVFVRTGVDGNPRISKHKLYSELLRRLTPGISDVK
ncbi:MAG: serine hydrolase [Bacteroidota bacterium]